MVQLYGEFFPTSWRQYKYLKFISENAVPEPSATGDTIHSSCFNHVDNPTDWATSVTATTCFYIDQRPSSVFSHPIKQPIAYFLRRINLFLGLTN